MSIYEGMLWAFYITIAVFMVHYDGYRKGRNDVIEELKRNIRERDGG